MTSTQNRIIAHLKSAYAYSELSKAARLKVGSVLVNDDRIISVGYNGTVTGGSDELETIDVDSLELVTKPEVLHAEENCIAFAAKNGISTAGCTMVTTDSPCFACSRLMIQAGIKAVYYHRPYRITDGIDFLQAHNIIVERIEYGPTQEGPEGQSDLQTPSGIPANLQADQAKLEKIKDETRRLRGLPNRKLVKAFGGCLKCYGKGYSTVLDYTYGAADFPGDKSFFTQNPTIRFCDCGRGQQLKELVGDNHK